MIGVDLEGTWIAIYRVDGDYFATTNVCTHQFAVLTDGWLEGHAVECPLHGGQFDVRNGKALGGVVEEDLRTYSVRNMQGRLQVKLGE